MVGMIPKVNFIEFAGSEMPCFMMQPELEKSCERRAMLV
jgi:hypothetical protein